MNQSQDITAKYRPLCFDEVIGQDRVINLVRQDFEKRSPGHCYLFGGHWGSGKTTTARLAALYLNCENIDPATYSPETPPTPCLQCEPCLQIQRGAFPELYEINAADNTGVDDSRALLLKLRHVVSRGKYRVVIIDECHRFSASAWDLWLKPLEDGLKNTVVIFCTTELAKVPNTIKSRSVNGGFTFNQVGTEQIVKLLRAIADAENITVTDIDLNRIAIETGGSVRDNVNALAAFCNIGEVKSDLIRRDYAGVAPLEVIALFDLLYLAQFENAYWKVSAWMKQNITPDDVYTLLLEHVTNMLSYFSLQHRGWEKPEIDKLKAQRQRFGEFLVCDLLELMVETQRIVKATVSAGYAVQMNVMLGRLYHKIQMSKGTHSKKEVLPTSTSAPEQVAPPASPNPSVESTFPDMKTLSLIATTFFSGRVTIYKPEHNKAMILLPDGSTIHILADKPANKVQYILASDIPQMSKCASIEEAKIYVKGP